MREGRGFSNVISRMKEGFLAGSLKLPFQATLLWLSVWKGEEGEGPKLKGGVAKTTIREKKRQVP